MPATNRTDYEPLPRQDHCHQCGNDYADKEGPGVLCLYGTTDSIRYLVHAYYHTLTHHNKFHGDWVIIDNEWRTFAPDDQDRSMNPWNACAHDYNICPECGYTEKQR